MCAQSNAVGVEHRPAAIGGEAVAAHVHRVDVGGAKRHAFFEHARAFVDERVDGALDDLVARERPARDAGGDVVMLDQREHVRVGDRLAVVAVAIPAAACLLAEPSHLAQLVGDERLARARLRELVELLPHAPRDVDVRPCRRRRRCPSPCRSR